ncbi:MAG: hypothetical protein AAF108_11065, partial [Planctomycetota bacterium]
MNEDGVRIEYAVHFTRGRHGQLDLQPGEAPPEPDAEAGAVPRIAKLMALAIRFDGLVRRGEVADFAEIAALGHVTRARVSQIVNLLNLAPDIQEAILFHEPVRGERDAIPERRVRAIAGEPDWDAQRDMWHSRAESHRNERWRPIGASRSRCMRRRSRHPLYAVIFGSGLFGHGVTKPGRHQVDGRHHGTQSAWQSTAHTQMAGGSRPHRDRCEFRSDRER